MSTQPGMDYWVTNDGIKVDFYELDRKSSSGGPAINGTSDASNLERVGNVIHFKFNGANTNPQPWGFDASKTRLSYFVGPSSKHSRNVHAYGEAYTRSLYPGVDLRSYYSGDKSRYDIVLQPGVDPSVVTFDVLGADSVKASGKTMTLSTSIGEIKQDSLFAYQPVGNSIRPVQVSFKQMGPHTIGFSVGAYDPRLPLVIDPLVYGTYFGSDPGFVAYEQIFGIQADDAGNLFFTGETSSITFPVTDGPYSFSLNGSLDAFLVRLQGDAYDTSYVAYLGGSGADTGQAIGFDRNTGAIWIIGETNSSDFPGTGSSGTALTGTNDIFMAKFSVDNTGAITPVSSRYFSDAGDDMFAIDGVVGDDGSVFVSAANSGLTQTSYISGALLGGTDELVAKFDSSGALQWERRVGSSLNDFAGRIAVDLQGNLVAVGWFQASGTQDTSTDPSPVFTTTAGVYPEGRLMRNGDMYIVKFDPTGGVVFASLLGGSNGESANSVATDNENNIYVSGATGSFDFPRNAGAYDQNPQGSLTVTKIASDGTALLYSTGLRTTGVVSGKAISVDGRGIAAIGGVVGWRPDPQAGPPPNGPARPALPGSITTVNPIDGSYTDGTNAVFSDGSPTDCPPTTDGFVIFLNTSGSDVLFADYIGRDSDDRVNDVFTDSVGATWLGGFSQTAHCILPLPFGKPKVTPGIEPYITPNAFKLSIGDPSGYPVDSWIVKLRIALPVLQSVTLSPLQVGGGLGATSTATISLREPAPVGGVTVTATLSNAAASSFSATPGATTQTLFFPEGTQTITTTVFSLPVTSQTTSDLRVLLDNDFVLARLTIKPWLDSFSISPATVVGGNQLTARVTLVQPAMQPITITLATSRPDLVTLPSPAEIIIPTGATTLTTLLDTKGVVANDDLVVSASLLGVTKNAPATLLPAKLTSLSFNPPRVNGGSDSVATLTLNGKTGADRTVTISHSAGTTGTLVEGNPLPATVTVPAQSSSTTFTVTTPSVSSSTFETLQASDGVSTAAGTIFIDDIDLAQLIITPATDVISGTVLDCQVKLTRAAGPGGFTFNVDSTNPDAGSLSDSTVTVPAGSLLSPIFHFNCSVVSTDQTTTITASKPGFTSRSQNVTVRAMSIGLTLNPTTVVGGVENSTGTITLSAPAPAGGLPVTVTSSDPAIASVPAVVTVPAGTTSTTFDVVTGVTNIDRFIKITATGSAAVSDAKTLEVLTPGIVSLTLNPSTVTGPTPSVGKIVVSANAPAGGLVINLSDSPTGIVTIPATVTIPEGDNSVTFDIGTVNVVTDTNVDITATLGSAVSTATLTIRSPFVAGITFAPPKVQGGGIAIGTITLNQVAPAGGLTIVVTSQNTVLASVVGSTSIFIPAGVRTGTFTVQTTRVSRLFGVQFSAAPVGNNTIATGMLLIKP